MGCMVSRVGEASICREEEVKFLVIFKIAYILYVTVDTIFFPHRKAKQYRTSEPKPRAGPIQHTIRSRSTVDTAKELVSILLIF